MGDKKTLLVDGMHCIYDKDFKVNQELFEIVNSFDAPKVLVVNGFREKGKEILGGNFEAFSLEEEGIKKDNSEFFKRLISKFNLVISELIYFDHGEDNVEAAKSLGINAEIYENNTQIKEFLVRSI